MYLLLAFNHWRRTEDLGDVGNGGTVGCPDKKCSVVAPHGKELPPDVQL